MKLEGLRFGKGALRALALALLVGLVFGAFRIGEPAENVMNLARNKLRDHPASGSIVLVAIDDRSLAEIGPAPWSDGLLADLIERVRDAGARRIHLDVDLTGNGPPLEAARLEATLANSGASISLPARFVIDPVSRRRSDIEPAKRFARHARLVNTNLWINWDDQVWLHPYAAEVGGRMLPSLAAVLAGVDPISTDLFPIDYGIDIRSIPIVSASDLLGSRVSRHHLAGRDVVIARTDSAAQDYRVPGFAQVSTALFQIMAAETLLAGHPLQLGWPAPFAIAVLIAAAVLSIRRRSVAASLLAFAAAGFLVGPVLLEEYQIHTEVVPALAVIGTAALARLLASLRRSYRVRGTTNLVSGMPNLEALRQAPGPSRGIIAAARIKNYAQITTSLEPGYERELVEQIVARLRFGTASIIYQADEGIFVWIADQQFESFVQQLEGLHSLFRSPIVIASRLIDLAVSFGLDRDASRPLMQRMSSALVAADDAARDSKRWSSFNPARLQDADWTMSILARLDRAIDNDELWVAYQPKLECQTGRIVGAEALVRWTHPEKGEIYPDQFIEAAERGGRIERLTSFVLDSALEAASRINESGRRFVVAVNLSTTLLGSDALIPMIETLLRKHGVRPELLMLEVTETSTLDSAADAIDSLQQLSDIGIQLSIDDYGTGFSTLEYLKRIPASELKIDRSFIRMLDKSISDRIMVNSTIQLAHSLGREVVAEGVENEEILDELKRMGCDIVQGYHTGRPTALAVMLERLADEKKQRAA